MMRSARVILCIFTLLGASAFAQQSYATRTPRLKETVPRQKRIVIAVSTLFDGRGHVLHNTRLVIEGSKIVAIDRRAGPVRYDLRGLTVLPGWIDAHVHITWSFGSDGKNANAGGTTPEATLHAASNAWVTLMAGFTTVQSVGNAADLLCATRSRKASCPARES